MAHTDRGEKNRVEHIHTTYTYTRISISTAKQKIQPPRSSTIQKLYRKFCSCGANVCSTIYAASLHLSYARYVYKRPNNLLCCVPNDESIRLKRFPSFKFKRNIIISTTYEVKRFMLPSPFKPQFIMSFFFQLLPIQ